ncbi:MAG: response regulator [Bacteroidales bacterium]|nr:response regulator [Bacteroidales bacterium]
MNMKIKNLLDKDPIIRQVLLLAIIAIIGFSTNLVINSYLLNISDKYTIELNNQLNKKELGTFLHNRIISIKSSMQELMMHQDKRSTASITEEIEKNIDEIGEILQVLAKGGFFIQHLPVNFYQNDFINDSIYYQPQQSSTYNLEIIDITPKIIELQNITNKMAQLKIDFFVHPEEADNINNEILLLYKEAKTYLHRAFENSNRIFYDTQKEYRFNKQKKEASIKKINFIKTILILLITGFTLILLILILKKIAHIVEARNIDREKILKNQTVIEKILDTIPVGFIIFDENLQVLRVNKQAVTLFSATHENNLLGKRCHHLFKDQDKEICPLLTDSRNIVNNELRIKTILGNSKNVIKNATLIDLDGRKVILETFIDITKRKQIESELISAKETAIMATQEKSKFLASMSHEIRTPLNGVIGMASLLNKTNLNEKQKGYLDIIQISSTNLVSIITDILDFSKIEAGEVQLEKHSFSIIEEIERNIKVLRLKAEEKGLELLVSFDEKIPEYIIGDSVRIKQVFINLVSNAIKFTNQGNVTIRLMYESDTNNKRLYLEVEDSGIGIPKERLDKIFRAFSQTDSSITRKYGGTGLGLTISKELIELMGGEIGVDSKVGNGSKFWFRIPTEKGEKHIEKKNITSRLSVKREELKILIAEDNMINQKVAKAIFNKLNYQIDIANNGKEAVEMYEENKYELIFMDLQMPVMDGLTATAEILKIAKQMNHHVFITAMTANAMKEDKKRCLQAGMCFFLSKPYKPENVEDAIMQYYNLKESDYCS